MTVQCNYQINLDYIDLAVCGVVVVVVVRVSYGVGGVH